MKKCIYLIIFLSFSHYGFANELYPKDINVLVEQIELCQHFLGEISGEPALDQARNLNADLEKYCTNLDQKRDKLREKYRHFPHIINKLNSYGKCLDDCQPSNAEDEKRTQIPKLCEKYMVSMYRPYEPIIINNQNIIIFTIKGDSSSHVIQNETLELFRINCSTGDTESLGLLMSQDVNKGAVLTAVMHDNKLFIIHYHSPPSGFGYMYANYRIYEVLAYSISKNTWVLDNKLTEYFGEGGDVINYNASDEASKQNLKFIFPYKTKQDIIEGLSNQQFDVYNKLANKEHVTGTIVRKTKLQEVANYFDDEKRYLIKGDRVNIIDTSAGWLLVEYNNPKKGIIKGWVMCVDTSICNKE